MSGVFTNKVVKREKFTPPCDQKEEHFFLVRQRDMSPYASCSWLKGCLVQECCSAFGLVCPVSARAVLSGLPGAKGYILPIPTPSWSVCFFQKHLRGKAVVQMMCTAFSLQYRSPAPSPSSRKYYISDCWFLAYNPYQTQHCGPGLLNICV